MTFSYLESKASVSKSLFPRKQYSVEYTLRGQIDRGDISYLIDAALRELLPQESLSSGYVQDLKGRDRGALLSLPWQSSLSPNQDEIFFLSGETVDSDGERLPFSVELKTEFVDFPVGNHIRNRIKEKRVGAIPNFLETKWLGRAFPLWPKNFRFSLDFFTNRFSVAMLGRTPLVTQSLQIEVKEFELALRAQVDRMDRLSDRPFSQKNCWTKLCATFQEAFDFPLEDDYFSKVSTR